MPMSSLNSPKSYKSLGGSEVQQAQEATQAEVKTPAKPKKNRLAWAKAAGSGLKKAAAKLRSGTKKAPLLQADAYNNPVFSKTHSLQPVAVSKPTDADVAGQALLDNEAV